MADVSVAVRAKRKRGRPRKDSNLCSAATLQSPENSSLMRNQGADQLIYPTPAAADATNKAQDSDKNCSTGCDGAMGSMVYGVVEGSFDAGYLISVRIGNNLTPFRGVVFQPRKVVAVTAANDVAPQAKMYQRRELPVPVYDNLSQTSDQRATLQPAKQAVVRPLLPAVAPYTTSNQSSFMAGDEAVMMRTGSSSNVEAKIVSKQTFPYAGSLRMVEEDEVMQAFEVSTSSGGSKSNLATNGDKTANQEHGKAVESPHNKPQQMMAAPAPSAFEIQQDDQMICRESIDHQLQNRSAAQPLKTPPNLYHQDINFHGNLFGDHHQSDKSPNLKLDLAFAVHKEKQMEAQGGIYTVLNGMKNPNIGYHQALVAGNPLLLPPDIMGEPLEFMMEKPKTPPTSQQTNMEVQSRLVGSGERFRGGADNTASPSASPYKLELATPHSALNTRIADMDFVISNAMQPAQSHTNN